MTKLATFRTGSASAIGVVTGGARSVFDLAAAAREVGEPQAPFGSMLDLIDSGPRGLEMALRLADDRALAEQFSLPLSEVQLLAPVPVPRQMRDGMSFPLHIRQSPRGMQKLAVRHDPAAVAQIDAEPLPPLANVYRELPIYYITNRFIVGDPGSTVRWPRYSEVMDYELEFGVFVGRRCLNASVAEARNAIFGFTIFNDFSARDQQMKEMPGWLGPAKGKSFDGGNVIGPWIVTPDEIGDPYALTMEARVNGEVWSRGTTEGMLFTFEEILSHMSQDETVQPGEFIGSGTVGNGCGLEHGRFLSHGDEIELEVENIGVLKNRVARQIYEERA